MVKHPIFSRIQISKPCSRGMRRKNIYVQNLETLVHSTVGVCICVYRYVTVSLVLVLYVDYMNGLACYFDITYLHWLQEPYVFIYNPMHICKFHMHCVNMNLCFESKYELAQFRSLQIRSLECHYLEQNGSGYGQKERY